LFYFLMVNSAIIWQAMVYQKAKQVYRTAITALTLRQQLQDEIEEHKQAKESLQHMAHHDALTGIANRRYFEDVFQRTYNLAARNQSKFGLLSLDLNDFKPVNDLYGHAVGDALLKAVTERLVETIRTTDFCARIGGDEFSVLIENVNSEVDILDVTYKLSQALSKPFYLQERVLHISASIGSALYPDEGVTMDALMLVADSKMYRQKNLF
ncbi:MAG: GGDEF domain-containing protein, partial [Gallionella sp.]